MVRDPKALYPQGGESSPAGNDVDAFDDDRSLMQAVAGGNARARRLLAKRLVNRTRNIARGLLGSGPDAEDAAQQSLLAILSAAGRYRGDAPIEGWAQSITIRVCLRLAKARQRRVAMTEGQADVELVARGESRNSLGDLLPQPLEVYLDRLPERHREAVFLRYSLGCSVPEIAERTHASIPTVRYRLWSGLRNLRRWIAEDERADEKERSQS